ncbi:MAG: hypothetical protein WCH04_09470, partial [Gammaproteobacteria bacterium]
MTQAIDGESRRRLSVLHHEYSDIADSSRGWHGPCHFLRRSIQSNTRGGDMKEQLVLVGNGMAGVRT